MNAMDTVLATSVTFSGADHGMILTGLLVTGCERGSQAQVNGVRKGWTVKSFDGKEVTSGKQLRTLISRASGQDRSYLLGFDNQVYEVVVKFMHTSGRNHVKLKLSPNDTVRTFKLRIESEYGIPSEYQRLYVNHRLANDRDLFRDLAYKSGVTPTKKKSGKKDTSYFEKALYICLDYRPLFDLPAESIAEAVDVMCSRGELPHIAYEETVDSKGVIHRRTSTRNIDSKGKDRTSVSGASSSDRSNSSLGNILRRPSIPVATTPLRTSDRSKGMEKIYEDDDEEDKEINDIETPASNSKRTRASGSKAKMSAILVYTGIRIRSAIWQAWWEWLFLHLAEQQHSEWMAKKTKEDAKIVTSQENAKWMPAQPFVFESLCGVGPPVLQNFRGTFAERHWEAIVLHACLGTQTWFSEIVYPNVDRKWLQTVKALEDLDGPDVFYDGNVILTSKNRQPTWGKRLDTMSLRQNSSKTKFGSLRVYRSPFAAVFQFEDTAEVMLFTSKERKQLEDLVAANSKGKPRTNRKARMVLRGLDGASVQVLCTRRDKREERTGVFKFIKAADYSPLFTPGAKLEPFRNCPFKGEACVKAGVKGKIGTSGIKFFRRELAESPQYHVIEKIKATIFEQYKEGGKAFVDRKLKPGPGAKTEWSLAVTREYMFDSLNKAVVQALLRQAGNGKSSKNRVIQSIAQDRRTRETRMKSMRERLGVLSNKFWWEIFQDDQLSLLPMSSLKARLKNFEPALYESLFIMLQNRKELQETYKRLKQLDSLAYGWWTLFWIDLRAKYGKKAPDPFDPDSPVRTITSQERTAELLRPINEVRNTIRLDVETMMKPKKQRKKETTKARRRSQRQEILKQQRRSDGSSPSDIHAVEVHARVSELVEYDKLRKFWRRYNLTPEGVWLAKNPDGSENETDMPPAHHIPERISDKLQKAVRQQLRFEKTVRKAKSTRTTLDGKVASAMDLISALSKQTASRGTNEKIESGYEISDEDDDDDERSSDDDESHDQKDLNPLLHRVRTASLGITPMRSLTPVLPFSHSFKTLTSIRDSVSSDGSHGDLLRIATRGMSGMGIDSDTFQEPFEDVDTDDDSDDLDHWLESAEPPGWCAGDRPARAPATGHGGKDVKHNKKAILKPAPPISACYCHGSAKRSLRKPSKSLRFADEAVIQAENGRDVKVVSDRDAATKTPVAVGVGDTVEVFSQPKGKWLRAVIISSHSEGSQHWLSCSFLDAPGYKEMYANSPNIRAMPRSRARGKSITLRDKESAPLALVQKESRLLLSGVPSMAGKTLSKESLRDVTKSLNKLRCPQSAVESIQAYEDIGFGQRWREPKGKPFQRVTILTKATHKEALFSRLCIIPPPPEHLKLLSISSRSVSHLEFSKKISEIRAPLGALQPAPVAIVREMSKRSDSTPKTNYTVSKFKSKSRQSKFHSLSMAVKTASRNFNSTRNVRTESGGDSVDEKIESVSDISDDELEDLIYEEDKLDAERLVQVNADETPPRGTDKQSWKQAFNRYEPEESEFLRVGAMAALIRREAVDAANPRSLGRTMKRAWKIPADYLQTVQVSVMERILQEHKDVIDFVAAISSV
uniref:Ubiquitin-like domain-containing protein n=1 Tax=Lotharella globosa TaxID=91324 RepID=A0A6V3K3I6_9EUKA